MMPVPPLAPETTLSSNVVIVTVPAVRVISRPVPAAVMVLSCTASVAVPLDPWLMSMPSWVAPVIVFSLIRTPRVAASADVTSMALPPVLARDEAADLDAGAVAVGRVRQHGDGVGRRSSARPVPAGTMVPKGAMVRPMPSPYSFWPFFSVMPP